MTTINQKIEEKMGELETCGAIHNNFYEVLSALTSIAEETRKEVVEDTLNWNKKRSNSYMRKFALTKNDYMDGWEDGWNKAVKDTTHYLQALENKE